MGLKGALCQREKEATKVPKNYFEESLLVYETEDSKQIGMEESDRGWAYKIPNNTVLLNGQSTIRLVSNR